ncbi:DHS-like NAD/FAD-binding domain-containing protein [Blastocladiella britannica]|nr:DHS-like NAD/FAD-binding domain-containing protein [Blastocladiella britannica]
MRATIMEEVIAARDGRRAAVYLMHAVERHVERREPLPDICTIDHVVDLLKNRRRILLVSGAGISVSCGIPDFRSKNGIYSRLGEYQLSDPTEMFDLAYFKDKPETFYAFACEIYPSNFKPSPSHMFVALLEQQEKLLRNYTQNIDDIESLAGIQRVIQCHGSFRTAHCVTCGHTLPGTELEPAIFSRTVPKCPVCPETSEFPVLKPSITFFGEQLPAAFHDVIAADLGNADLVVVIGSSLKVAPVSEILKAVPHSVPQVLINKEQLAHLQGWFDVELIGDADTIVADLCRRAGWTLPHAAATDLVASLDDAGGMSGAGGDASAGGSRICLYPGGVLVAESEPESSESESDSDSNEHGPVPAGYSGGGHGGDANNDDNDSDDDDEGTEHQPARTAINKAPSDSDGDPLDSGDGISDDELAALHADAEMDLDALVRRRQTDALHSPARLAHTHAASSSSSTHHHAAAAAAQNASSDEDDDDDEDDEGDDLTALQAEADMDLDALVPYEARRRVRPLQVALEEVSSDEDEDDSGRKKPPPASASAARRKRKQSSSSSSDGNSTDDVGGADASSDDGDELGDLLAESGMNLAQLGPARSKRGSGGASSSPPPPPRKRARR